MYHFAYGSNMNINELKKYILCKNIIIVGIGYFLGRKSQKLNQRLNKKLNKMQNQKLI